MTARRRHRASLLLRRLRLWDRRAQRGVFPPDPLLALWERRVDAARSAGDNEAGELSEHLAAILRVLLAGRIDTVEEDARNPDAAGSSGLRSDLARLWNDLVAAQQLMGTDPTLEPELGRLTRLQASLSSAPLDPNVSEPVAIAPSPYREVSGATLFSSEIVNAWWNARLVSFASSSALSRLLGMPLAPADDFDALDDASSEDVADWTFGWPPSKAASSKGVGDVISDERIAPSPQLGPSRKGASGALKQEPRPNVLGRRFGATVPAVGLTRKLIEKAATPFGIGPSLSAGQVRPPTGRAALPTRDTTSTDAVPAPTRMSAVSTFLGYRGAVQTNLGRLGLAERATRLGTVAESGRVIQRASRGQPRVTVGSSLGVQMPLSAESTAAPGVPGWADAPRPVDLPRAIGEEVALPEEVGPRSISAFPATPFGHSPTDAPSIHPASIEQSLDAVDVSGRTSGQRASRSDRTESFLSGRFPRANRSTATHPPALTSGQPRLTGLSLGVRERLRFALSRQRRKYLGLTVDRRTGRPDMLDGGISLALRVGDDFADQAVGPSPDGGFTRTSRTRTALRARQSQLWDPGSHLTAPIDTASARGLAELIVSHSRRIEASGLTTVSNRYSDRLTPAIGMPVGPLDRDWPATIFSGQKTRPLFAENGLLDALTIRRNSLLERRRSTDLPRTEGSSRPVSRGQGNFGLALPSETFRLSQERFSRRGHNRIEMVADVDGPVIKRSETWPSAGPGALGASGVTTGGLFGLTRERMLETRRAGRQFPPSFDWDRTSAGVTARQNLVGRWSPRAGRRLSPGQSTEGGRRLSQASIGLPLTAAWSDEIEPVSNTDARAGNENLVALVPGLRAVARHGQVGPSSTELAQPSLMAGRGLLSARRDDAPTSALRIGRRFASSVEGVEDAVPRRGERGRGRRLGGRRDPNTVRPTLGRRHGLESTVIGPSLVTSLPVRGRADEFPLLHGWGKGLWEERSPASTWRELVGNASPRVALAPTFVFDLPAVEPNAELPSAEPGLHSSPPARLGMAWMPGGEVTVAGQPANLARGLGAQPMGATARRRRGGVADFSLAARGMNLPTAFESAVPKRALNEEGLRVSDVAAREYRSIRGRQVPSSKRIRRPDSVTTVWWMPRNIVGAERLDHEGPESTRKVTKLGGRRGVSPVFRGASSPWRPEGPSRPWGERERSLSETPSTGLRWLPFSGQNFGRWSDDAANAGIHPEASFGQPGTSASISQPWTAVSNLTGEKVNWQAVGRPFDEGSPWPPHRGDRGTTPTIGRSVASRAWLANSEGMVAVRPGSLIQPSAIAGSPPETKRLVERVRWIAPRVDRDVPPGWQRRSQALRIVRPMVAPLLGAFRGAAELPHVRTDRHDDFLADRMGVLMLPGALTTARVAFHFDGSPRDEEPTIQQAARQVAHSGGVFPLTMAAFTDRISDGGRRPSREESSGRERSRATSDLVTSPGQFARPTPSTYPSGPPLTLKAQPARGAASPTPTSGAVSRSVRAPTSPRSVAASSTATIVQRFGDESGAESKPSTSSVDLDTLARQVYALLKQRLAVERERSGLRGGRRGW